jgi:putative transposase
MSAVFVELTAGGHLRIPCADLGRPAVTLWEQRLASRTLREAGHRSVDETAIFAAIAEQRRVLAEAQASSKVTRRTPHGCTNGRYRLQPWIGRAGLPPIALVHE